MAALESTRLVRFTLPPLNPPFRNRNTLWPAKTSRAIPSLTSRQKARRPAATVPRFKCQAEAERNMAARAEGRKRALADSDEESDDDLPSLEELSRTALRRKTSTEASKPESTVQRLEQPALDGAGLQVDRIQPGLGEGESPERPVILDDDDTDDDSGEAGAGDEAEGASGDVDTGRVEGDASPQNTSAISELASGPTESIDASGLWYDIEEGRYIEEPAPGPGPCEQQGVPSALTQGQPQTLPPSSTPLQDEIDQQGIDEITRSTSVESALHSLPKPSDSGDDGWTDENMAELEKELGLALEEKQVKSPFAGAPTSPSPRSVEAPQDEVQNRERSETTGSRPEEPRDACQRGTPAQGLEWGQRETRVVVETIGGREAGKEELVGEAGGVEMEQQEELAGQNKDLEQLALVN